MLFISSYMTSELCCRFFLNMSHLNAEVLLSPLCSLFSTHSSRRIVSSLGRHCSGTVARLLVECTDTWIGVIVLITLFFDPECYRPDIQGVVCVQEMCWLWHERGLADEAHKNLRCFLDCFQLNFLCSITFHFL